jgi:hypothetical protein
MRNPERFAPRAPRTLWAAALISLFLNVALAGALVYGWATARRVAGEAATALDAFADQTITYQFRLNQTVPVRAEVPFEETLMVPVRRDLDINTTVTVSQELPVIGQVTFDVPIRANIPVSFEIPFVISQTFPVQADVPLNLEIPVELPIRDTPLKPAIDALSRPLKDLAGR